MMFPMNRTTNGFDFVFEHTLTPGEEIIVRMPSVSVNKRGINDIGWQTNGDVTLFGTLSNEPESKEALWQELKDNDEVNKTIRAIKIVNSGDKCQIVIRAILN